MESFASSTDNSWGPWKESGEKKEKKSSSTKVQLNSKEKKDFREFVQLYAAGSLVLKPTNNYIDCSVRDAKSLNDWVKECGKSERLHIGFIRKSVCAATETSDPDQVNNLLGCLREYKPEYGAWSSNYKHQNRPWSRNFTHYQADSSEHSKSSWEEKKGSGAKSKHSSAPWHNRESKPSKHESKDPVPEPRVTPPSRARPLNETDHKPRRPLQDLGSSTSSTHWKLTE